FEKSIRSDAAAIGLLKVFLAVRDTPGTTAVYGRMFGVLEKAADIGVATASNWLIGGTPRISSIVRSTETGEEKVESIVPVWVYGLITDAVDRWASTCAGPSCASSS